MVAREEKVVVKYGLMVAERALDTIKMVTSLLTVVKPSVAADLRLHLL